MTQKKTKITSAARQWCKKLSVSCLHDIRLGTGSQPGFWQTTESEVMTSAFTLQTFLLYENTGSACKYLLCLPVCSCLHQKDLLATQSRTSGSSEREQLRGLTGLWPAEIKRAGRVHKIIFSSVHYTIPIENVRNDQRNLTLDTMVGLHCLRVKGSICWFLAFCPSACVKINKQINISEYFEQTNELK